MLHLQRHRKFTKVNVLWFYCYRHWRRGYSPTGSQPPPLHPCCCPLPSGCCTLLWLLSTPPKWKGPHAPVEHFLPLHEPPPQATCWPPGDKVRTDNTAFTTTLLYSHGWGGNWGRTAAKASIRKVWNSPPSFLKRNELSPAELSLQHQETMRVKRRL